MKILKFLFLSLAALLAIPVNLIADDNIAEKQETTKAAFIYIAPENDYKQHKAFIDSPVVSLAVVGVKDYDEAEKVAKELVKEGVTAIELCAGFGFDGVARISKAVEGKALVGVVRFDLHPAFNHQSGDNIF